MVRDLVRDVVLHCVTISAIEPARLIDPLSGNKTVICCHKKPVSRSTDGLVQTSTIIYLRRF